MESIQVQIIAIQTADTTAMAIKVTPCLALRNARISSNNSHLTPADKMNTTTVGILIRAISTNTRKNLSKKSHQLRRAQKRQLLLLRLKKKNLKTMLRSNLSRRK
jgi:hypothetical protein